MQLRVFFYLNGKMEKLHNRKNIEKVIDEEKDLCYYG